VTKWHSEELRNFCSSPDIIMALTALYWALAAFFSFLILYIVGRTPWTGDQPFARHLPTDRTTQTPNKHTKYRHPCVEWIRTHDLSVRASEDSSCLTPRGHCVRPPFIVTMIKSRRMRGRGIYGVSVKCIRD
jgi:hypothetical protein